MILYLIPPDGDLKIAEELVQRAGATLITPSTVRDLILDSQGESLVIATVSPEMLLVLNRHATQLLEELPSVLIGVPGMLYSGEWYTLASAFVSVDWSEMEKKLQKSGHTAFNLEDHEKRSVGSEVAESATSGDEGDLADYDGGEY